MKTTTLGRSGLEVSRLALGTWEFSGAWGNVDEDNAIAIVRRARELGFNFFDTAHEYGFGTAERILGTALRHDLDHARDEVVIATKGGLRETDEGPVRDARPEWLRHDVDTSLSALGIDHIDLYQVHWPDPAVPAAETAGALAELVASGKIRHVGVSNYDAEQIAEFSATLPVETVQPPFNMLRRELQDTLFPYCRDNNIGVLVYGALAHGLLTGTISSETRLADDDWRALSGLFSGEGFARNLKVVAALRSMAGDLGVTLSQLALAWTLAQPGVHVAIVGAQQADYLQDSAAAVHLDLSPDDLAAIAEILAPSAPLRGPYPEMWKEFRAPS
ncbi:aldo/keto reductase [Mycolicibacter sinensis]|uniref:General stress protein n=1 Tax=Mycolicibacter sinensis (strain JDM601) TaxID=875328 RepID=A0A1A2YBC6_MYCSD|nr:aldo/keto reductase [Mycolicibacter sinensis]OBH20674.1 general stress protein [Mycolicibacter sinensis]OBI34582.1 general stress protein [Mycolicibacter sinensis]